MHRDERHYPDAQAFRPERWSPEFKASLPRYAYFPFGGGSRHCIGESFAWMELTLLVAWFAHRWDLRVVPGHRVVPHPLITLRSKHGMPVTLSRRGSGAPSPNHAGSVEPAGAVFSGGPPTEFN
jgi:cytochrome P450